MRWTGCIVALIALFMIVFSFPARDFEVLPWLAAASAIAGVVFVPTFDWVQRSFQQLKPLWQKAVAGALVGALLSLTLAGLLMYLSHKAGGVKGARPSNDFLLFYLPFSFLVPLLALIGSITPTKLLTADAADSVR